jgi:hypothetical protein
MPSMVLGGVSSDVCEGGGVAPRAAGILGVDEDRGGNDPGGLRDGRGGAETLGLGRGTTGRGPPTSVDADAASTGVDGCEPGGWAFSLDGDSLIRRALRA